MKYSVNYSKLANQVNVWSVFDACQFIRDLSLKMNSQIHKTEQEQKVQYEIPKVVCTNSSLQLMTKAYVLTASKIARERLHLPGKNFEKKKKTVNENSEKYFNKKHVGRVELDVLKPKPDHGGKRIDSIIRKRVTLKDSEIGRKIL